MDATERDEELVKRLVTGETAALEALYDQHAGVVFALMVRIVGDRQVAEELLQETFLRAWQHAGTYQGERGRLRSWLLGIAHNLALNELRRRRRRPGDVPEQLDGSRAFATLPDPGPEPWEAAWGAMRRTEVAQALERLPAPQRAVIELYAAGYSQSEIAARLGEPLGTVKTRMRRGLHHLRDLLRVAGVNLE